MDYIKLFEDWHTGRKIENRKEYNEINLDWSKFLTDLDYTYSIIKQLNPNLETQWQQEHAEYLELLDGKDIDDYSNIESIEDYVNNYIKEPIRDYMKLFDKVKKKGYLNVTRVLSIDNLDEINFDKIGKHWSFCDNPSQQFDNSYKEHYVQLIAKARLDSINWLNSLDNYVYYGDDECEITLKEGSSIFIEKMISYIREPSSFKTKKDDKTFYNFTGNKETIDINKKAKI